MKVLSMKKLAWFYLGWVMAATVVGVTAQAAPRMDTGVGSADPLLATVVPDHEVPNLYYVFPQASETLVRADGRFDFLYIETWKTKWGPDRLMHAEARLWVRPTIDTPALKQKLAEIKASNPAARFAVVTAFKTEIVQARHQEQYFNSSECQQISGPLEIPVYCRVDIKTHLASGFKTLIQRSQAQVFHYVYSFYGFANGQIQEFKFAVPLKLGTIRDPSYFVDQWGREL